MARRSRRRSRDYHNNARRSLHAPPLDLLNFSPTRLLGRGLRDYEDLRTFDPSPRPPVARTFSGRPHQLEIARPRARYFSPAVQFSFPQKMVICARRRIRREVLFSRGNGGRGFAYPRRNYFSDVRC